MVTTLHCLCGWAVKKCQDSTSTQVWENTLPYSWPVKMVMCTDVEERNALIAGLIAPPLVVGPPPPGFVAPPPQVVRVPIDRKFVCSVVMCI